MSDASVIQVDSAGAVIFARVTSEKVGAREAQIIEHEVKAAAAGKRYRAVIDLSQVAMLASMGLGALVTLHKLCAQNGGMLVVFGLRDEIAGLLKVTHLDRVLKTVKTRDDAAKMF